MARVALIISLRHCAVKSDRLLVGLLAGLFLTFEEVRSILQQLALPGADHSRVDLESGGDFGFGLVNLESGQGDFGVE